MSRQDDRDAWTKLAERAGNLRNVTEVRAPAASKFRNTLIVVDGYTFDSKKEAARYQELKYMQKAGQIADLELQPVFPLHVMELFRSQAPIAVTTVGVFTADFRYVDLKVFARGEVVVEDVKSDPTKTEAYRLRKKIAEAVHGIHIREV